MKSFLQILYTNMAKDFLIQHMEPVTVIEKCWGLKIR